MIENPKSDFKKSKINETILSEATRADAVELDSINDRSPLRKKVGSELNKKKIKLLTKSSTKSNLPEKSKLNEDPIIVQKSYRKDIQQRKPRVPKFKRKKNHIIKTPAPKIIDQNLIPPPKEQNSPPINSRKEMKFRLNTSDIMMKNYNQSIIK